MKFNVLIASVGKANILGKADENLNGADTKNSCSLARTGAGHPESFQPCHLLQAHSLISLG